jgi:hypothetical protein
MGWRKKEQDVLPVTEPLLVVRPHWSFQATAAVVLTFVTFVVAPALWVVDDRTVRLLFPYYLAGIGFWVRMWVVHRVRFEFHPDCLVARRNPILARNAPALLVIPYSAVKSLHVTQGVVQWACGAATLHVELFPEDYVEKYKNRRYIPGVSYFLEVGRRYRPSDLLEETPGGQIWTPRAIQFLSIPNFRQIEPLLPERFLLPEGQQEKKDDLFGWGDTGFARYRQPTRIPRRKSPTARVFLWAAYWLVLIIWVTLIIVPR